MAKLTEKQKQKARGIREVRRSERRLDQKKDKVVTKPKTTKKEPVKTKGITNIIRKRSTQAGRVFNKARGS